MLYPAAAATSPRCLGRALRRGSSETVLQKGVTASFCYYVESKEDSVECLNQQKPQDKEPKTLAQQASTNQDAHPLASPKGVLKGF
jgi:hypothetical protein